MPHKPRKRFGQHFLRDHTVIDKFVAALALQPDDKVIEIGPGEGVLTSALLAHHPHVTAVEIDYDLADALAERFSPSALQLVNKDVLDFHIGTDVPSDRYRVVGNLPYNISTPLIFHLLKQVEHITDMHIMVQKEVALRFAATPGTKAYGRLSVMLQVHCDVVRLFDVPPGAFYPPPKVDSSVCRLKPRVFEPACHNMDRLAEIVRHAFSARRKTIHNALKGVVSPEAFAQVGLNPTIRPEQISVAEYVALANLQP